MVQCEFAYPSANGRTDLHAVEWLPEGAPRGVVLLSHGVGEHILRYAPFARVMTQRGFAVVGHDHLGHGTSVEGDAPRLYFGKEGSWQYLVEDLYARRKLAAERFPGVPCFLLGHSMGSFVARTYLIRCPGTVDGAILMGTGQPPAAVTAAGRAAAAAEVRLRGETAPSPRLERLIFGGYNRRFAPNRTELDWLSVSCENVDAYLADPLCGGTPTAGLFREMLGGIAFISKTENLRRMNLNVPVLFVSGSADPVGENGKGVRRAYEHFKKAGVRDVTMKLYPGLRHEILNEHCGGEIAGELAAWMEEHLR